MSINRIAGTYAKSLLDLAVEQDKLEDVKGDMDMLEASLESRDLYLLLKSPIISKDRKQKALDAIFGDKLTPMSKSFIDIVLRKGREEALPEIIGTISLTTATPISEANLSKIKARLLDSDVTAKNVDIETIVDPDLIGGFVLKVGDKLYDDSVAHKLAKLKKEFSVNDYEKKY